MLIYIHGFNSSARSHKAGLVAKRMAELGRGGEFACPELPHRPSEAIALLERLVTTATEPPALIGSSLGGFYATWLAERHGSRTVLVNPAVRPYELLVQAVGRQRNLYTGTEYEFTPKHLEELRALEVPAVTPARYLLITRTGDEVLDYRDAVEQYRGCEQIVEPGGDHGFGDFDRYIDRALAFCAVRG
ncbi:MAG TPA: YqiA/YcfP family alpha/beta fold hydrolase [Burkholderiales bacterium]|nr:YqiA/YcfP family alpha/beta fold hydrolase [Burkholderiales bacterium]